MPLIGDTIRQTSVCSLTRQWVYSERDYSCSVCVKSSGTACHAVTSLDPLLPQSVLAGDMHELEEIKERNDRSGFHVVCGLWSESGITLINAVEILNVH